MILKALYDYYNRSENLPRYGRELKEIGFVIVLNKNGEFLRFEDRRIDKKSAQEFLVKKSVSRSSAPVANYLYDNSQYVFGYMPEKGDMNKMRRYFDVFKTKVDEIYSYDKQNISLCSLHTFYQQEPEAIIEQFRHDTMWDEIDKNLNKKYSTFSFLIEGETEIVASQNNIICLSEGPGEKGDSRCLVTGEFGKIARIHSKTPLPGSTFASLISFQKSYGFDSYGKEQAYNAPISQETEFAYTTALNHLLRKESRNKFMLGTRTYLFWASSNSEAAKATEDSIFAFFGKTNDDDPNQRIELVRQTFMSIYEGKLSANTDDKFFILGLAPNAARIAVVYWAEIALKDFARLIGKHFSDMEMVDTRKDKTPYVGLHSILGAVTLGGKSSDATPNLPDAVVKSIFQGLPYPSSLYQSCVRRIRAEQALNLTRAAIIKAYLNRLEDKQNKKLNIMLDKENQNQGYLCGRLFAVLDKIQEDANGIHTIRERYMNSASATPAAIFSTILNLSMHHLEKLNAGSQIYYEKLKQEIVSKLDADGFPAHLDLQDQGRFFVGYYHQRQDFFTAKENKENEEK